MVIINCIGMVAANSHALSVARGYIVHIRLQSCYVLLHHCRVLSSPLAGLPVGLLLIYYCGILVEGGRFPRVDFGRCYHILIKCAPPVLLLLPTHVARIGDAQRFTHAIAEGKFIALSNEAPLIFLFTEQTVLPLTSVGAMYLLVTASALATIPFFLFFFFSRETFHTCSIAHFSPPEQKLKA